MIKMKLVRRTALILTLSAVCAVSIGCSSNVETAQGQSSAEEHTTAVDLKAVPYGDTETIKGYQIIDGPDYPVTVTIGIKDVQSGTAAYNILKEDKPDLPDANKDMEYVIITVSVTYDDGEPDVLSLAENIASLDAAKLYFSLGDAADVTSYLNNNIYNMSVKKGECVQGDLAFLRMKDSNHPLGFWGFGSPVTFEMAP